MEAVILLSAIIILYACRSLSRYYGNDNMDRVEFRYELENRAIYKEIEDKDNE